MNINYIGYYKLAKPRPTLKHYILLAIITVEYIVIVDQLLKTKGL